MEGMGFVFKLKKKRSEISLLSYGRNGVCIQAKEKKNLKFLCSPMEGMGFVFKLKKKRSEISLLSNGRNGVWTEHVHQEAKG